MMNEAEIDKEVTALVTDIWLDPRWGSTNFDEQILRTFVDYSIRCNVDGAAIEEFLNECLDRDIDEIFELFYGSDFLREYPRIYYCLKSVRGKGFLGTSAGIITEYILKHELDLLVDDFERFGRNNPGYLDFLEDCCVEDFSSGRWCQPGPYKKIGQLITYYIKKYYNEARALLETHGLTGITKFQLETLTRKDFHNKWKELIKCDIASPARDAIEVAESYTDLITKWGNHFPAETLLKKEIERNNKVCVDGVLQTTNERALRVLFAYVYAGFGITLGNKVSCVIDGSKCVKAWSVNSFFNKNNINNTDAYIEQTMVYHKLILLLSNHDNDENGAALTTDAVKNSMFGEFYVGKEFLIDVLNTIKYNAKIGEKIKKNLDAAGINLFFKKPTPEEFLEYKAGKDDALNLTGVPHGLYEEYSKCRDEQNVESIMTAAVDYWWYEKRYLRQMMETVRFDNDNCNRVRGIVLEKPTFFPKHDLYNENMMAECLFREETYRSFVEKGDGRDLESEVAWKRYLRRFMEETYKNFEQPPFAVEWQGIHRTGLGRWEIEPLLPLIPQYGDYLLTESDRIFSTAIRNKKYYEFTAFLTQSRKAQIKKLLKKGYLQPYEADKLTIYGSNYYAWSDAEIKRRLRSDISDEDFQVIRSNIEPEFTVNIFTKSILWVLEHRDSELWLDAPWFGMQIFNKSYADCPSIWARHLVRIAKNWSGGGVMLVRICVALGHLRELLGSEVPRTLQEIADREGDGDVKRAILAQKALFDYGTFNKGHNRTPEIRVRLCKEALIKGQNAEVAELLDAVNGGGDSGQTD